MNESDGLTIGRLAAAAGVHVETVRYYQRVGLLRAPLRPSHGYRHYPAETVDRIRFIKRAQALGFALADITELLALGDGRCADVRRRAEARREQIAAQVRDLQAMLQALEALIGRCQDGADQAPCPIVQTLSGHP